MGGRHGRRRRALDAARPGRRHLALGGHPALGRAFPDLEEALYFAIASYTTVGFGDLVAPPEWRILGASIAANGMPGFGIATAALIDLVLRTQNELRR